MASDEARPLNEEALHKAVTDEKLVAVALGMEEMVAQYMDALPDNISPERYALGLLIVDVAVAVVALIRAVDGGLPAGEVRKFVADAFSAATDDRSPTPADGLLVDMLRRAGIDGLLDIN